VCSLPSFLRTVARRNMTATYHAHRRADDKKQGLHYSHFQPRHVRKCLNGRDRQCRPGSKPRANPRRAAKAGVRVVAAIAEEPLTLLGDPARLEQVVTN